MPTVKNRNKFTKFKKQRKQENVPKQEKFNFFLNSCYDTVSSFYWILAFTICTSSILIIGFYNRQIKVEVHLPFEAPKVIEINNETSSPLWGTYRPGAYLGLRTNEPSEKGSVAAGLMWYTQKNLIQTKSIDSSLRHTCENLHEDVIYGFIEHDAINYGHQVIKDGKENKFTLDTIFLRPDSNTDWTTRIIYETNNSESAISLIWYAFIDPGEDEKSLDEKYFLTILKGIDGKLGIPLSTIIGSTPSLSNFKMTIIPTAFNVKESLKNFKMRVKTSISSSWCPNMAMLKHCLGKSMNVVYEAINEYQLRPEIVLNKSNIHNKNDYTSNFLNNFVAVQVTITHSYEKSPENTPKLNSFSYSLDVAYTQQNKQVNESIFKNTFPSLIHNKFDEMHTIYSNKFHEKFKKTFPFEINGSSIDESLLLNFAKATFSNMAGSLGYFYGTSLVRNDYIPETNTPEVVKYWSAGLLTVVPSRSQFPRGFLWDDGFHGLMLGSWSIELQLHILGHWMDLLNNQGWIPREQILGSEARFKVPENFVVQSSKAANPPALFLTVDLLLRQIKQQRRQLKDINSTVSHNKEFNFNEVNSILKKLYPRLKAWYSWFNDTQRAVYTFTNNKHSDDDYNELFISKKFNGYRWRGRDARTDKELNPKTLTSGMDDYPRSSHPVNDNGTSNININNILNKKTEDFDVFERHVDLFCWMAHGSRVMYNLHHYLQTIGEVDSENIFSMHFWMLVKNLDRLHWTDNNDIQSLNKSQISTSKVPMYADFGVHTDDVRLKKGKTKDFVRVVGQKDPPRWRFVDSQVGYNALYPMFFRLVDSSQRLNAILDLIEGVNEDSTKKHKLLTKRCGLRSLSMSSPLYNVRNTMNDPPYWRGSVWINMQYLACSSLYYYANLPDDNLSSYTNHKEDYLEPIKYLDMKTKNRCNRLYNKIRNDVIHCVYREWNRTGFVWEQYGDKRELEGTIGYIHKGKGTKSFTGWSAIVVLLMSEIY